MNLLKESDLRSECQLIRVKHLKDVKKCNRKVDEVIFRSIFFVPGRKLLSDKLLCLLRLVIMLL